MFKTVRFRNFKSFKDFSVQLKAVNVLVGPNNAGKSTILDAFRAAAAAHSFASRRVPTVLQVDGNALFGYDIPVSNFPISLVNIHTNYFTDEETSVTFTLDNRNAFKLTFHDNARCILTTDSARPTRNTGQFKANFPLSIYPFPTLGPLEEEELLLTDEYVRQFQYTRRAHRMFRNIWYRRIDQFASFQALVERTWEGMTIAKPELDLKYPPRLSMFCKEGRVDREIFWVGFGFQVWLQLLTHLIGAESDNVLVVDEPEIYLHPDLQHRLFNLLKETNKQVILATHSPEIVNEAEHNEVILIDKSTRAARRVEDIDGLQDVLFNPDYARRVRNE
jgi:energy-coupling factor transporter ATP-binding protein EcfA2